MQTVAGRCLCSESRSLEHFQIRLSDMILTTKGISAEIRFFSSFSVSWRKVKREESNLKPNTVTSVLN